jgi:hypothetical protein
VSQPPPGPTAPGQPRSAPPSPQHTLTPAPQAPEPAATHRLAELQADAAPGPDASTNTSERLDDGGLGSAVRDALAENARAAERNLARFCAESRRLQQHPAFSHGPHTRDAALFLNGRVDWEPSPQLPGGRRGTLHLPTALTARVRDDAAWLNLTDADLTGLDFGWMEELQQFDHWSLASVGPLHDRDHSFLTAPLPDYTELVPWARLRLVRGLLDGDLERASRDVRHLGALIASNGSLLSELVRNQLFGVERRAWVHAGREPSLPLPTQEQTDRYRAVARASTSFLMPGVSPEVQRQALACAPARCVAIHEGVGLATTLRNQSPTAQLTVDWLAREEGCDTQLVEFLKKSQPATEEQLRELVERRATLDALLGALDGG